MGKMKAEVLKFYKQTSLYTDLGLYKNFALKLPNDIKKLCLLQRNQIIHPFDLQSNMINKSNSVYGDMRKIDKTRLHFESDLFPTAQSILAELLRRNPIYSNCRPIEDKIHLCCREQAILLASILKSKGYCARVRSGFAPYIDINKKSSGDHWITEYYDTNKCKWKLVDADMFFDYNSLIVQGIDLLDIPKDKFIFGAEAYLGLRNKKYENFQMYYASNPTTYGLKAAIRALFYDFHCLMNNEIIFLHQPKYIFQKNFELSDEEYNELDELANLMLHPNDNFEKLLKLWNTKDKFRIMCGALNS